MRLSLIDPTRRSLAVFSKLQHIPGDCQQRQQDLKKEITDVLYSGRSTDWWLWYSEVNADKDDWRHFVPDLHREGQAQAGRRDHDVLR